MSEYSITDISAINRLGGATPTYQQQTFLGASISSFTANGGFGDSSSTLGVELVVDEYNVGDTTGLGQGQDVYHNGIKDNFKPPPVGSPVFFTFGSNRASVQDAYVNIYNQYYGTSTAVTNGANHFTFGGILQSFTQNKSSATYAMYSAQVVDPREILSNVQLVLNNYGGSTFGCDNIFNIYGFLEFNSTSMQANFASSTNADPVTAFGAGTDMWFNSIMPQDMSIPETIKFYNATRMLQMFPITGTGFSRRMPQGIPYYRIAQALNAFSNLNYTMPADYISAGFGGYVNFRGMKYAIDLSALPQLPPFYFIDYDQINVLDLCLEICDITNHDLFVTLLPIIDHPACATLYQWNQNNPSNLVAGIIKVDAINRSQPPVFGAIKNFIDQVKARGVPVENQDLGFELSNIVTDKFVTGAQEVDMYFFSGNSDRNINPNNYVNQWTLEGMYKQQILPYYGLIGNGAVTIPKGFGPYQQILLDASNLQANGVGNYYVATEMELRCASVSFERWCEFLMMYNDIYMESIEDNDIRDIVTAENTLQDDPNLPPLEISNNYAVTVPRSVWTSDNNSYDSDGLPVNTCNPPYGWPLYYKRATQIGLPQAGLANITAVNTRILTQLTQLKNASGDNFKALINSIWKDLSSSGFDSQKSTSEKEFYKLVENAINNGSKDIALIERQMNDLAPITANASRISRKNTQNAMRVYNFVKQVADECLGKKFLVKIPQSANDNFADFISNNAGRYDRGPFGFPPRDLKNNRLLSNVTDLNMIQNFLTTYAVGNGELTVNYNPFNNLYEFNYQPDNQGGYFSYYSLVKSQGVAAGVSQGLIPIDITNFKNDNNRISAYARFDNSHHLSFDSISKDSFAQQTILNNYHIPDVSYLLDNTIQMNNNFLEPPIQSVPSVAFVKCDVDEKLYMPPVSFVANVGVHGRKVNYAKTLEKPKKFFDAMECKPKWTYPFIKRHYYPVPYDGLDAPPTPPTNLVPTTEPPAGGNATRSNVRIFAISNPNNVSLDKNHVYALITLPNKIIPTVSSRYRDAMAFKVNATNLRHFLLMDTVQGLTGFDEPKLLSPLGQRKVYSNIKGKSIIGEDNVENIINKTFEGLTFALPNRISVSAPSPVYPDLVVLPLRSKERCYGPWISSFNSIGGKMEFVKDENLAPWNYAGYSYMNEAGKLQAEFGYSASLISERGGFTIPDIPAGVPLGKALVANGPLITSISVEVSQNGIRSTYKMDSYTQSFGKLQKQKENMIANISRAKQKQQDERNALIRQGIGKNQTNVNYNKIYRAIENQTRQYNYGYPTAFDQGAAQPASTFVMSVTPKTFEGKTVDQSQPISQGSNSKTKELLVDGSVMSINLFRQGNELFASNGDQFSDMYFNSAASNMTDMYTASSLEPDHPNMSYMPHVSIEGTNELYKTLDGRDNGRFTTWGRT